MRWTPLLLSASLLTGCAAPPQRVYAPPPIPDRYSHLLANFGAPRFPQPFCYRTLGDPECRAVPLPGEESRLINDPQPRTPYRR